MTEFAAFNASTHPIVLLTDWNAVLNHGLEKAAAYIVRVNGSYFEAILGSSTSGGTIAFGGADNAGSADGTSAQAVIQACIDALEAASYGGIIFLQPGLYEIDASLTIAASDIQLIGSGHSISERGTMIKLANNSDCDMIVLGDDVTSYYGIVVDNLQLNGGKGNQASGNGITYQKVHFSRLSNLLIDQIKEHGIYSTGNQSSEGLIEHVKVKSCDSTGVELDSANDSHISDIVINDCPCAIKIVSSGIYGKGIHAWGCDGTYTIWITGNYNVISTLSPENNEYTGLAIDGDHNVVSGWFWNNGQTGAVSDHVICSGDNNIITGTFVKAGSERYGVNMTGTSANNIVTATFEGTFGTATILDSGTGNQFHTTGYVERNCGHSTGISHNDTIAHGLSGTPSAVVATASGHNINVGISSYNATTFTVQLMDITTQANLVGTTNIDWYARIKP